MPTYAFIVVPLGVCDPVELRRFSWWSLTLDVRVRFPPTELPLTVMRLVEMCRVDGPFLMSQEKMSSTSSWAEG